jgi:histidyl-tRNA synthetase
MSQQPDVPVVPVSLPEARLVRGFRDTDAAEIRAHDAMIATIREVYERYGFEPLATPVLEYSELLGKFLPDDDRPNAGVFSIQDEDEAWMSLRYDLTAPLARYVAQNFERLPKPYRRYATGPVFRNENSGPTRFRQFIQFDADTVGAESVASDAEMCMLAADTLDALKIQRGDYVVKVNHRRLLDAVLETIGITDASDPQGTQRLTVLRAIDKLDRLGASGVRDLLGAGRKDESGDFTKGAGLGEAAIVQVLAFVGASAAHADAAGALSAVESLVLSSEQGVLAIADLRKIMELVRAAGYGEDRIRFDSTVVRGLEYYTGPVFEAELTFQVKDDAGQPVRFGSVGGGGRYDNLVTRFLGQKVPATGFSIGVSRLQAALAYLKPEAEVVLGPVVVLVMDKGELPKYQALVQKLRSAGIRAEMYLGSSGMKPQMKYADRRGSACVVIQGSNEREKGEVQLKDLIEGAKAAGAIKDNKEWKESRPAQVTVKEADLVEEVQKILARYAKR